VGLAVDGVPLGLVPPPRTLPFTAVNIIPPTPHADVVYKFNAGCLFCGFVDEGS